MKAKKFTQKHEEWLLISEEELKLAKLAVATEEVIIIPTVFLAQQAAEKALKAYLAYHKQKITKTHDLVDLVENCIELDAEFAQLLDYATRLNPFITQCRYPDTCFDIPDLTTVKMIIEEAEKILEFVKAKISVL